MKKIVKLGGEEQVASYYFPPDDFYPSNKYELEEFGYSPNLTICDTCLDKSARNLDVAVVEIDRVYINIIDQLKEMGLLSWDYPLMCCRCFDEYQQKNK